MILYDEYRGGRWLWGDLHRIQNGDDLWRRPAIYGKRNGYPTGEYMVQNFLEASVDIKPDEHNTHLLAENTHMEYNFLVSFHSRRDANRAIWLSHNMEQEF